MGSLPTYFFSFIFGGRGSITITITANQGSTELINEARTEEAPLRFMDKDVESGSKLIFGPN